MKKGIVLFTAIVSLSTLLAGCGGTANTVSDTVKEGTETAVESTGATNIDSNSQQEIMDKQAIKDAEVEHTVTPTLSPTPTNMPTPEPLLAEDPLNEVDMSGFEAVMDTEVDMGLLTVTINVPKDMVSSKSQEELDKKVAEDDGYISAVLNTDGSATYVMTKAKHNEMMVTVKELLEEELAKIPGSENTPNITSVTMNASADVFTVMTTNETLSLGEQMEALVFYGLGAMYNQMNGTPVDNIRVDYINAATGQIIDTANSKNMK